MSRRSAPVDLVHRCRDRRGAQVWVAGFVHVEEQRFDSSSGFTLAVGAEPLFMTSDGTAVPGRSASGPGVLGSRVAGDKCAGYGAR